MANVKHILLKTPVIGSVLGAIYVHLHRRHFRGSHDYWIDRYLKGRDSGEGSYGVYSAFKAEILNRFVKENEVETVIEFGCGDGHQLSKADYPLYTGLDISEEVLHICRSRFEGDETKQFLNVSEYRGGKAELALSLDVIYHLVEDDVFESYMHQLFSSSERFVIIYASNGEEQAKIQMPHIRHRKFTDWVENNIDEWELFHTVPNQYGGEPAAYRGSFADFFFYQKR